MFGPTLQPDIRPLGYDRKIGIALLTSFAAREVFVGTMSTSYSVGRDADMRTVQQKQAAEKDANGMPVFTVVRASSLLVFYTKGEWPLLQLLYMTGLA